jgi:hypothetical protein
VIISEVRPDGEEQYVQAGWLDVAQRKLAAAGNGARQSSPLRPYQTHTQASYQPLTPHTPVYARVELLPFEHVFRAGSSIRITIDSAMGAVQSTGYWGLTGLPAPFQDTVYATPTQQSQIVHGLIPGATAKAPLPACDTIAGEPCRPNAVPYRRADWRSRKAARQRSVKDYLFITRRQGWPSPQRVNVRASCAAAGRRLRVRPSRG